MAFIGENRKSKHHITIKRICAFSDDDDDDDGGGGFDLNLG